MQDSQEYSYDGLADLVLNRYYGKYRGMVKNNNDPLKRGRLEVAVPGLLESVKVWAMPCVPFAGKDMGFYMIPDNDTGVWIEFEGGDVSFPIWSGCFWANDESPNSKDAPTSRTIRTTKGLTIELDDEGEKITITDKQNNNVITIEATGTINVKASSLVSIEAGQIKLGGDSAIEPVVKGTQLVTYLTTVATTLTTAGIPVSPPTPVILSTKVKTA